MDIEISNTALNWYKDEVGLKKGDRVKFYPQIYGKSPVQESYAIGFAIDNDPIDMVVKTEKEGLMFYIDRTDLWFFNGHNLHVDYNGKKDELEFSYTQA